MKIRVEKVRDAVSSGLQKVITFRTGKSLYADVKEATFDLDLQKDRHIYLYGDIFYYVKTDGKIILIDSESEQFLKKSFSESNLEEIIANLEGQYIGLLIDKSQQSAQLFSDRYARADSFYIQNNSDFYFATDLDFSFENMKPEYDQKMLAHIFSVFGWFTPKGLTMYKNVKQLQVGEIITLTESGMQSDVLKFEPMEIENYGNKELEVYYDLLRESIIARANGQGKIWVSSSSGWDSSIILGLLVNELGPRNVGMVTGSMEYSDKTDAINKFEIDKIKKIGDYYGIKPIIVDFDFKSKTAPDYWEKLAPYYKSKHVYTISAYNFVKLSDVLRNSSEKGQIIFNGETSDSFHNFGFSQFATFFHTKKSFTEYADKMNCYLYGPSFFKKVIDGNYERDKVFQIFKTMAGNVEFTSVFNDKESIIESYLFPFLYGSPRIPFAKTYRNPLLTDRGQNAIYNFPFREYMPEILSSLSEKNIYAWLIYLYHSFHSQGSTVSIQKHAMEYNKHRWRMPFNDCRLIEFLSKAPEEWGRGLDFNNTKYPLKWVAKNKIKFPYELLDEGPHSYLYDVIEGFSLLAEVTYRSGVTDYFKDTIRTRPYKTILSDEYFDTFYLDQLVTNYLDGNEVSGTGLNNLVSLITLCITGWY